MINFIIRAQSHIDETVLVEELTSDQISYL